jgi:hypothetical protein
LALSGFLWVIEDEEALNMGNLLHRKEKRLNGDRRPTFKSSSFGLFVSAISLQKQGFWLLPSMPRTPSIVNHPQ